MPSSLEIDIDIVSKSDLCTRYSVKTCLRHCLQSQKVYSTRSLCFSRSAQKELRTRECGRRRGGCSALREGPGSRSALAKFVSASEYVLCFTTIFGTVQPIPRHSHRPERKDVAAMMPKSGAYRPSCYARSRKANPWKLQSTQVGKPRWLTPPSNAFLIHMFYDMKYYEPSNAFEKP